MTEDKTILFNKEQEVTIRFQILFGMGMIVIALVAFWGASKAWEVDLRFAFFFVTAIVALTWFKDGMIMLADVAITIMKMRQGKQ